MPESINSLSPDFRDFLLNRNLITDTVTDNGLDALLVGIGVPYSDIGTPPEAVQPSADIVGDGDLYKDLNLVTNKYQGSDDDYRLASIDFNSAGSPPTSAFIYSSSYTDEQGVLNNTLNTPANGPFQGGDIRDFNTSKNLYDDESKRLLISLDDVLLPNVKYTNYIDLNSDIVNPAIDVLGSIFNGQGIGVSTTAVVPSFDLRSSLVGRVLGGTGVIADTPIGQAGAKYLALALANNAAFGLQQETIGHLNLNPLNLAKNGLGGIVVPNYNITVPSGQLGRVVDFTARVLGFESPLSLYERSSSIFQSENPVSNILRANAQLANTGKGQVLSMFANVKMNKFKPAFQDDRVRGGDTASDAEKAEKGSGINPNIYAFGTPDGGIVDLLNTPPPLVNSENEAFLSPGVPNPAFIADVANAVNSTGFESNYGKITSENEENLNPEFSESPDDIIGYGPDGLTKFSWGDVKDNRVALETFSSNSFTSPNSLLTKTQSLFNSGKMKTLVSGHYGTGKKYSQIQTAVATGDLISKGSGVLTESAANGNFDDVDNVFCRTWTTFDKYDQVSDLQKSEGINVNTAYREGYVNGDSVLGDNGFVKIGPYIGDTAKGNIKNFMFSLENLAWADNLESLLDCEKGPGDPMGKSGRIMWFPPYDLTVTENTSVNWESTNFIGRGEPIYTYSNTERTGTLQFKIVVDHPSYLNAIDSETDDYIASFFAGCTDIDSELAKKLTPLERDEIEVERAPEIQKIESSTQTPEVTSLSIFLPNDVSVPNPAYENKFSEGLGTGLGTTEDSQTVSIVKSYSTDRNNFGLNGDKNPTLAAEGGWITEAGKEKLRKSLNEICPACTISIKGYASQQGQVLNPNGNKTIQINRANEMRKWLEDNILNTDPNIVSGKITFDDRFKPWNDNTKAGGVVGCEGEEGINDDECLKVSRKAVAEFKFSSELQNKINCNTKPVLAPKEIYRVSQRIINRFYNECNYFEKLRQQDKVVFDSLKEKLKFFHPAFHAITPEGLNSRLTFLQQCTRQGPTNISNKPDNLAFGRPPVCILRLGDFYHTKIVIDNIGVSYEPLVWDLNPEGIGVQPMIATVDLSFKMIGGQSMKGPINKLQNAVSFNFFGNTQIYDVRADKLKKVDEPEDGKPDYEIVPGETVLRDVVETLDSEKIGLSDNKVSVDDIDRDACANDSEDQDPLSNTGSTASSSSSNAAVVKQIGINEITYVSATKEVQIAFSFTQTNDLKFAFNEDFVKATGKVFLVDQSGSAQTIGGFLGRITLSRLKCCPNDMNHTSESKFGDGLSPESSTQFLGGFKLNDAQNALISSGKFYSIKVVWRLKEPSKDLIVVHKINNNITKFT